jgi:transcriptional regulator with XRE-family HTH domain
VKRFGPLLYAYRKAAALTQQELAERVGCSKSYISTLERDVPHSGSGGSIRPSEAMVADFARALGIPLDALRLAAGYAPLQSLVDEHADPPAINSYYAGLPPAERKAADEIIYALWLKAQRDQTTHGRKAEDAP